jgi:hypothetical protein
MQIIFGEMSSSNQRIQKWILVLIRQVKGLFPLLDDPSIRPPCKYISYNYPMGSTPGRHVYFCFSHFFWSNSLPSLSFPPPYISQVWHDLIWLTNDLINWWPCIQRAARWQCVKSWRGTNPTLAINDGEILVVWIVFFSFFLSFFLLEEDEEVGAETRKS